VKKYQKRLAMIVITLWTFLPICGWFGMLVVSVGWSWFIDH